jgi:hypothetical protein
MARTGGRFPYDKSNAATGPARVVWAELTEPVPSDLSAIVAMVADVDGEYPLAGTWNDFGLAADAPQYSHDKKTDSLAYEQPAGGLFEQVSEITRQFKANVAEIEPENLKIVENSEITQAIATSAAGAPTKKGAQTLVHIGTYASLKQVRIALLSNRPDGAGEVTEPGGATRPPFVGLILPVCTLAAETSQLTFKRGDPVAAEITFTVVGDPSLGVGKEHGYWALEAAGAIAA